MDGVLVDNTKYHVLSWQIFYKKFGKNVSSKYFIHKILGRTNTEAFKVLGINLPQSKIKKLLVQKEAHYRRIYKPYIKSVKGLHEFLKELKGSGIKIALATSAPTPNIDFVLAATKMRKYFKIIVRGAQVEKSKPYPDIFLLAAKKLKVQPKSCIVFEDAMLGIQAAKAAGMKVVGVATSHKPSELRHTDLVIKDFRHLKVKNLENLWTTKKK